MYKIFTFLLVFLATILSFTQNIQPAMGGGAAPFIPEDKISPEQHAAIQQMIDENVAILKQQGKITSSTFNKTATVMLEFPLAWNTGFNDYGFYGISNFVDHDAAYPGFIQDYNCGTRSYDTDAGYNHQGIDYFLWPFSWNLMHEGAVKIVAAAPGMIVAKTDGYADESCAMSGLPWNSVYIRQADGSTAWYGHMATGSLTTKGLGDMVETGEYLGRVGSSGNSTGPHLHFELYDADNNLMDPNAGPCNNFNDETWWNTQRNYYDPAINKIQTHFAPPAFSACPDDDVINAQDSFARGDMIYFIIYAKDLQDTTRCQMKIEQPDGTAWQEWDFYQPDPYYSASYWFWWYTMPMNAQYGIWNFSCTINGTYTGHDFYIVDPNAADIQNNTVSTLQTTYLNGILIINGDLMDGAHHYTIFDMAGRSIINNSIVSSDHTATIRCENLPAGWYILQFDQAGNSATQITRFLVTK